MSRRTLFQSAWARLLKTTWGAKIRDHLGKLKDTAVHALAEELAAIFASEEPIDIYGPINIRNHSNGVAINIQNLGSQDQTAGIRITDEANRVTQLGIGLGSIGIVANEYIPLEPYSINPQVAQQFLRDQNTPTFGSTAQQGLPVPEPGPGSEPQQVNPGFNYTGGSVGGGGGTPTGGGHGPGLGFSFVFGSPIVNVNHQIIVMNRGIIGRAGLSDTFSVVTEVECSGGTLTVTYEDLTFGSGVLKDRA